MKLTRAYYKSCDDILGNISQFPFEVHPSGQQDLSIMPDVLFFWCTVIRQHLKNSLFLRTLNPSDWWGANHCVPSDSNRQQCAKLNVWGLDRAKPIKNAAWRYSNQVCLMCQPINLQDIIMLRFYIFVLHISEDFYCLSITIECLGIGSKKKKINLLGTIGLLSRVARQDMGRVPVLIILISSIHI